MLGYTGGPFTVYKVPPLNPALIHPLMYAPILTTITAFVLSAHALPPITAKGNFLFDSSTGQRFTVKGLAYSANYGSAQTDVPTGGVSRLDSLANVGGCIRDIPFFKQLGVNLIRVYQVNASLDHSACINALDAAGIYVIADLATPEPNDSIASNNPSWNTGIITKYINTIDALAGYSNVLGFSVGNEVINSLQDDDAAPYIKAAARDVKAYIKSRGLPQLVGYAATDSPNSRISLAMYLACGDVASSVDFWGLNIYEWCGGNSYEGSGYKARTDELRGLGIPAFFTEYGCNSPSPRTFQDIPTLFSSPMNEVWSGGIIYEFQQEGNNFGLGQISPDGSSYTPNGEFAVLQAAYGAIQTPSQTRDSYTPSVSLPVACPTSNSEWPVSTKLPATPNGAVCQCVVDALSCRSDTSKITDVGTSIGTVCGLGDCSDIAGNGTTGTYGALSFCDPAQQLDIVMDRYFESQNRNPLACNFDGLAALKADAAATPASAVASATSACITSGFPNGVGLPSPTARPSGATSRPIVSPSSGASPTPSNRGGSSGRRSFDARFTVVFGALFTVYVAFGL